MNIKGFLKPNFIKILIFLFIGIFYIYFASESTCGVSQFFTFCYKAYGFPLAYLVAGDINAYASIDTLFLGEYFTEYGNVLFNPVTFILNLVLIYLLACFVSVLVNLEKN